MLSEASIRYIAEALIGDTKGYYSYKSLSQIVEFFNSNFGLNYTQDQSVTSRWFYTVEKIKVIINSNQFDNFLNLIFSKSFVMKDSGLNDVQAVEKIEEILEYINDEISIEGYKIHKRVNEYFLISEDGDLEFIGEGGFANVYKLRTSGLVVKKLKDDFKTVKGVKHRFRREYDLTKSLSDIQGIITIYDFDDSEYSYTMEIAEKTLEEFMKELESTELNKIDMIRQVLHVMKNVHDRNIIHRDISPNNVLIFNGQLKISDFGLGKDLDMFYSHRTMRTHSLGQYHYCAPEQFMQLKEGDKRSDVFSLGRLINFIMTGDPRNSKHFMRNPVEKATSENSNMRFSDAGELIHGIEQAISYHQNQERKDAIKKKFEDQVYDEDVENYLYSLNGQDLCNTIATNAHMTYIILTFIEDNEKRMLEVMQAIFKYHDDACIMRDGRHNFNRFDVFTSISYSLIRNNAPYLVQELAAKTLCQIAIQANRFNAQRKIEELIAYGIDPTIEDLLK
ncbi:protein kinase domain-containing protein [Tepidibacter hydrothermalis]|uniref:Protein kinase n=1 Tax=Tepidibacter hydrothermalis TaxID=3036126 RepID=A0ABY8EA28_9FIRM|nr:protein kinase [Tepidibacter hydrothermalis]WFD09788.1 protein kinase [Tepidibacter hydrothermalis]